MNEDYRVLAMISRVFTWVFCGGVIVNLINYVYIQKRAVLISTTSPLVFPALMSGVLIICLVIDSLQTWRSPRKPREERASLKEVKKEFRFVLFFILWLLLYVRLLPVIKFLPATIIFMSVVAFFMNTSQDKILVKAIKSIVVSCVFLPVLYYVFSGIFKVILP